LQKSYCLEDQAYAWEYLFGPDGKVSSLLRGWRFDLKTEFYTKIEEDWERFWKLDTRVDTYHFGALLIYWDLPKIQVYSLSLILLLELSSYITIIIFLYTLIINLLIVFLLFFKKDNSRAARQNRASMEYNHFLGSQSFAQIEHKYKKKTVYAHAHIHTCIHTIMYTHAHSCKHMHMHIHTRTYTHSSFLLLYFIQF